jgi:DNA-binding transcriptional LysR family regulator
MHDTPALVLGQDLLVSTVNLHRLEIFVGVVEAQSVSRAAERLFMSQPAVSQQVRALERELGATLLFREHRRVVATEAGEATYRYAKTTLSGADELIRTVQQFTDGMRGRIVVGASTTPGNYILPGVLTALKTTRPNAQLTLRIAGVLAEIQEELLEGATDFAFTISSEALDSIVTRPIRQEALAVMVAPSSPLARRQQVAIDELLRTPLVVGMPGAASRQMFDAYLAQRGIHTYPIMLELGNVEAVKQAVRAGAGPGVLLASAAEQEIRTRVLAPVALEVEPSASYLQLLHRPGKHFSPLMQYCVDFVVARTSVFPESGATLL